MPLAGQSRVNPGDTLTLGSVTYAVEVEDVIEQEVGVAVRGTNNSVPRLGEYFIRRGILSRDQVIKVAERQSKLSFDVCACRPGQVAYEMGFITRSQLDMALADQRALSFNDEFYW